MPGTTPQREATSPKRKGRWGSSWPCIPKLDGGNFSFLMVGGSPRKQRKMPRKRRSEERIIYALKQIEGGPKGWKCEPKPLELVDSVDLNDSNDFHYFVPLSYPSH
jgi:hypothetical protein